MSDYKDNALVVQSNQFVRETANNLKAAEIKMFDVFVSCIDTKNPKTTIQLTKSELVKALKIGDENYTYTAQVLKSLFEKSWKQVDEKKTTVRHFIEKFTWWHDEDTIQIEFHKDILPMLVDLKTNFLQYSVQDLNCLNSRYSMLLYKYVLSYIRQYKTTDFIVSMEDLRAFLNLKKKYSDFRDFNKNVLQVFETEVNKSKALPYLVRYDKLTRNKKVNSIHFVIRPRTSNKETDFFDIQNQIMYEELYNKLIKGDTSLNDIRNRQADTILEEQQSLFDQN